MKAISIRQPIAYLAGCIVGDAWLTRCLGLRVADADFAAAFCEAIKRGFDVPAEVVVDERGYFTVRKSNGYGRFNLLRNFQPVCDEQRAAFLRGLFDSEGNVVCARKPKAGKQSWDRRVSIFSTNVETLDSAKFMATELRIACKIVSWAHSAGHLGTKPVFGLMLHSGKDNFALFAETVGSSIGRKQASLNRLASSYHPDIASSRRQSQLLGAETKRRRTAEITLPAVLRSIANLIEDGEKPTLRRCLSIPGYSAVLHGKLHSELVAETETIR